MARKATIERNTKETEIKASINIDGEGKYNIDTGIGFLDHMLEQLSKHSLIDINIKAKGDLHIDFHHTTEDCGIALGQAFKEAIGNKMGITRYGSSYIAMDEALSRVALDISGRPFIVWRVSFTKAKIGDFDTELFQEFFTAFAHASGITLHVENLYGTNNHHIIESTFKALAKALRISSTIDERAKNILPSTKGAL